MRRLIPLVLGLMVLAGCAVPPPQGARTLTGEPFAGGSANVMAFTEVVARMEPFMEQECTVRAPRLNCDFVLLVDDRDGIPANAFQTQTMEGRPIIVFTSALIDDTRNADELAFILSHEAAHHIAGHLERTARAASIGAQVLARLSAEGRVALTEEEALRVGAELGARRFSREFELEADALGAVMAYRAGYDPVRGSEFFFRIPDPGNEFLGTHPPNGLRIAVVRDATAQIAAEEPRS